MIKGTIFWPVHEYRIDSFIGPSLERLIEDEFLQVVGKNREEITWGVETPIIRTLKPALHLKDVKPKRIYDALFEEEPFYSSLKIDLEDHEEILEYVRNFGLPSPLGQTKLLAELPDGETDERPLLPDNLYAFESIPSIQNDFLMIRGLLHRYFDLLEPATPPELEALYPPKSVDTDADAEFIIKVVEKHIGNIHPELSYKDGKLVAGFTSNTLLDALVFRVFEVISGTRDLRRCANHKCSAFFIPKRFDQKYCKTECSRRDKALLYYRVNALHKHLVPFVEEKKGTWAKKFAQWNIEFPNLSFRNVDSMKRTYKKAVSNK